jgi:hypothetical protein
VPLIDLGGYFERQAGLSAKKRQLSAFSAAREIITSLERGSRMMCVRELDKFRVKFSRDI